jgi:hypothetical protein
MAGKRTTVAPSTDATPSHSAAWAAPRPGPRRRPESDGYHAAEAKVGAPEARDLVTRRISQREGRSGLRSSARSATPSSVSSLSSRPAQLTANFARLSRGRLPRVSQTPASARRSAGQARPAGSPRRTRGSGRSERKSPACQKYPHRFAYVPSYRTFTADAFRPRQYGA